MKKIMALLAGIIPVLAFSQALPSNMQILGQVEKMRQKDHPGLVVVPAPDERIWPIQASFTGPKKQECLFVCPLATDAEFNDLFMLLYTASENGYYEPTGWYRDGSSSVDTIDVDRDGVAEIIVQGATTIDHIHYYFYKILSLAGGKENVMYSCDSFDSNDAGNWNKRKPGEAIDKELTIEYKDLDNDGKLEIVETLLTDNFVNFMPGAQHPEMVFDERTTNLYLVDGKFVKKQ